jgi:hypothetical protein
MARPVKKKSIKKRRSGEQRLPLTKINYTLLLIGVGFIIVGYLFMLEGSVDGVMPITISPILLVIGYCVVIPVALLYRKKEEVSSKAESTV